jgi:hypothetical protein
LIVSAFSGPFHKEPSSSTVSAQLRMIFQLRALACSSKVLALHT